MVEVVQSGLVLRGKLVRSVEMNSCFKLYLNNKIIIHYFYENI